MGGRLDDRNYVELRVHGVAGTPPESTLGLVARPIDPPADPCGRPTDAKVQTYGSPDLGHSVQAFSWRSLTSGSAKTALWILLLPFMLANVAGWALVPLRAHRPDPPAERPVSVRWIILFVRLAGLVVTAIYAIALLLTFVDLIGYQGLAKGLEYEWAPALGVAATALTLGGLFWSTRVRRRSDAPDPWDNAEDPAGRAWLDRNQRAMWDSPGIIVRLRRLHLAAALGLTAFVSMASLRGTSIEWDAIDAGMMILAGLATALSIALVVALSLSTGAGLERWTLWIRWSAWVLSTVAAVGAVWRFARANLTDEVSTFLPSIRGSGAWLAVALLVLVGGAYVVSWNARDKERTPKGSSFNQPSLLLTGATVAMIYGIGIAAQAARFFGEEECPSDAFADCKPVIGHLIDWISVGFTLMLTTLIWVLGVMFVIAFRRVGSGPGRAMRTVRDLTTNVSRILRWLVWIGVTGVVAVLGLGALQDFGSVGLPGRLGLVFAIALVLPFVIAGGALVSARPWWQRVLVVAALGAAVAAGLAGQTAEVFGISLPPQSFKSLARVVAITLPTSLVVGRLIGGLRNVKTRRGVAVLWDLGTFWPRWFHPFAPPTYSDAAVTKLTAEIDGRLEGGGAVLLAPHSQGSIIGAASILLIGSEGETSPPTDRLALLSYGSPLSRLYGQAFPALYTREALDAMFMRLAAARGAPIRWRNLFRKTDPIGGSIVPEPPGAPGVPADWAESARAIDIGPRDDECDRKHSAYPDEQYYKDAAAELRAQVTAGL